MFLICAYVLISMTMMVSLLRSTTHIKKNDYGYSKKYKTPVSVLSDLCLTCVTCKTFDLKKLFDKIKQMTLYILDGFFVTQKRKTKQSSIF